MIVARNCIIFPLKVTENDCLEKFSQYSMKVSLTVPVDLSQLKNVKCFTFFPHFSYSDKKIFPLLDL